MGNVRQAVTMSQQQLIEHAQEIMRTVRDQHGAAVDANTVEVRLWVAALMIHSLDGAIVADPVPQVMAKLELMRQFSRECGRR